MDEQDIKRKLATIMVADIVGFSRLTAQDEDGTIRALGDFRKVVDGIVARHDGRIFNTGGDSVLAEFASPVEAVRCAVDFQQAASSRNLLQRPDRQLRFRIGINLGDVMVRGSDLLGDGVNVAARLEGLAEPGGICVSGTVWDHINDKLSLGYVDIGEQTVKNIPRPIRAYQLRMDGSVQEVQPMAPAPAAPPVAAAPSASGRKAPIIVLSGALAVIVVAGILWAVWPSKPASSVPQRAETPAQPVPFAQGLSASLVSAGPKMDEKYREAAVREYITNAVHKAQGIPSDSTGGYWTVWSRSTAENATESALEGCQVFFGRPCVLMAVDDKLETSPADGNWRSQDMPRARYSGDFEPGLIPGAWSTVRERSDIAGYLAAAFPKAVSLHPILGRIFVVTGAASQRLAEEKALETCNSDPVRNRRGGSCFLYAVGDRVVLPLRLREPLTAK